jgi:small-conductance mechanosensitive channel/CRP-like cAMP-binding protein
MVSADDILHWARDPFVQTGLTAVVGAIVTHILFRRHPTRRLVGQLVFFALLTALLMLHGIVPYDVEPASASSVQRVFIGLAKIIWWANAAWSLVAVVRVFLIIEGQPREGRLAQDLVVGVIYVAAVLSVIAYVFEAPIGTLIATSGVLAIILGLALQSTLNDVFSGIALSLGRPYAIGDRLALGDGITGHVIETNWRATHLLDDSYDLVIIPNSDLAKARLTNLSSPSRSHGMTLSIRLLPTANPDAMAEMLEAVIESSNTLLRTPKPWVVTETLDASAVTFELGFHVADVAQVGAARSELLDLVYRHAKASGFVLAAPPGAAATGEALPGSSTAQRAPTLRLLDAVGLFAALSEDEKCGLADAMAPRFHRKGEVILAEGTRSPALVVIRRGVVSLQERGAEVWRLAPGDYLGVTSVVMGQDEAETSMALTPVVTYEISHAALATLIDKRPALAEELAMALSRRSIHAPALGEHERAPRLDIAILLQRVRTIFNAAKL